MLAEAETIPEKEPPLDRTSASWRKARQVADSIGVVQPLFSSAVRLLRSSEQLAALPDESPEMVVATAGFLIRVSPSLQAVFYFAAQKMYPEKLAQIPSLSIRTLMPVFKREEIAVIVALTYLHRAIKRLTDEQEWRLLVQRMYRYMEIGSLVGQTVYGIDRSFGMLIPAVRMLAFALLSKQDLKTFQTYRRSLDKCRQFSDIEEEEKLFGCNHLQVSTFLVQYMGFGLVPTMGISLIPVSDAAKLTAQELASVQNWFEASQLIEAYCVTGSAPHSASVDSETDAMSVPAELAAELEKHVAEVLDGQTTFDWLEAQKNDLPQELRSSLVMPLEELLECEKAWAEQRRNRKH